MKKTSIFALLTTIALLVALEHWSVVHSRNAQESVSTPGKLSAFEFCSLQLLGRLGDEDAARELSLYYRLYKEDIPTADQWLSRAEHFATRKSMEGKQ